MPDEPEAAGLVALMLFHHSRRNARLDAAGDLITLEDQDRARWDRAEIDEARTRLEAALRHGHAGPYQLQAAIAACHADAADVAGTDWDQIASLYDLLAGVMPSPVVALNRAVAIAMARGPETGLEVIDALEASGELADYHLLHATRADLLRRLGRTEAAAVAYRRARELAGSDTERRFLDRRLEALRPSAHHD
jgi:RNA polymerase sigma-70 factor (ECF subfamily)